MLFSLFSIILILEIFCRLFFDQKIIYDNSVWPEMYNHSKEIEGGYVDKETGLSHDPGGKISRATYALFDQAVKEEKQQGEYRVIVLGDSYTYGVGTSNSSNSWTTVLQKDLEQEKFKNIKNITILPFAKGGLNTYQEYLILLGLAFDFNPDMIILQWTSNDNEMERIELDNKGKFVYANTDVIYLNNQIVPVFPFLSKEINSALFRHSALAKFLSFKINTTIANFNNTTNSSTEYILKFSQAAKEKNIPFLVLEFPAANINSCRDEASLKYLNGLNSILDEQKINWGNLCNYVGGDITQYSQGGQSVHYNDEGYRLAAEMAKDKIINLFKK